MSQDNTNSLRNQCNANKELDSGIPNKDYHNITINTSEKSPTRLYKFDSNHNNFVNQQNEDKKYDSQHSDNLLSSDSFDSPKNYKNMQKPSLMQNQNDNSKDNLSKMNIQENLMIEINKNQIKQEKQKQTKSNNINNKNIKNEENPPNNSRPSKGVMDPLMPEDIDFNLDLQSLTERNDIKALSHRKTASNQTEKLNYDQNANKQNTDQKNQSKSLIQKQLTQQQNPNKNFKYIVKPSQSSKNISKNPKTNQKYQEQILQFQKLQQIQLKEIQQKNKHIPQYLQQEQQLDLNNNEIWQEWENINKLKIQENFNIFKIPKIKQAPQNSTIIGVIDQSGSMQDCFQWLATEWNSQIKDKYEKTKCCIFHNLAYEAPSLQKQPEMGTTEVEAGFTLLNSVLMQQEVEDNITVIFVSDGQDNNQNTIFERLDKLIAYIPKYKKINFLTIGVGEQFPTYLAMQLRQMYHTGESTIPPVFLVHNQHIHENWKVTFKLVNKYLSHNSPIQTQQEIQSYPWTQPQHTHYENSYVFSNNMNQKTLKINTENQTENNLNNGNQMNAKIVNNINEIEIQPINKMQHLEILEIGSFMLSNIQLRNLKFNNPDATKREATIAYKILLNLKQNWWGKQRKKLEERMQIETLLNEIQSLIKDPDLKNSHLQGGENDRHLALKLAVGGIAAGIGLYWLSENYGTFANLMGGMNFAGDSCFGSCGIFDQCAQCIGCESCGQCCADIFSSGKDCISTGCVYICKAGEYLGGIICGILGE
ncbi:hypothetical protein PPERSA_03558 [Pseudocohnilembus persalinus]|uniref:VWFA domain-containing protein n=1 Tax=Pseudocohnilembus persalinus TaxID=266149 RepID=A0A0V0QPS2_PSEPJ|nr:hypothetical protein PPERSA_03558 [Pseudocohnilembus persalinus]|eukprot:KRX04318.1 hypothetical protein PPERSA_03558 [Pseudocohnilembus persalinus]